MDDDTIVIINDEDFVYYKTSITINKEKELIKEEYDVDTSYCFKECFQSLKIFFN